MVGKLEGQSYPETMKNHSIKYFLTISSLSLFLLLFFSLRNQLFDGIFDKFLKQQNFLSFPQQIRFLFLHLQLITLKMSRIMPTNKERRKFSSF